jgi:hypothetical protein
VELHLYRYRSFCSLTNTRIRGGAKHAGGVDCGRRGERGPSRGIVIRGAEHSPKRTNRSRPHCSVSVVCTSGRDGVSQRITSAVGRHDLQGSRLAATPRNNYGHGSRLVFPLPKADPLMHATSSSFCIMLVLFSFSPDGMQPRIRGRRWQVTGEECRHGHERNCSGRGIRITWMRRLRKLDDAIIVAFGTVGWWLFALFESFESRTKMRCLRDETCSELQILLTNH